MRSGLRLFLQQLIALLKKNLWLAMRNKRSTLVHVLAPFIFVFILFAVDKANTAADSSRNSSELRDPPPLVAPPIPPCEDKFHIRRPCFDFVWSGNASAAAKLVVSSIMANNPGRPIPPYKVKSFGTPEEIDAWLFRHPLRCPGALHFIEKNGTVIGYGVQTNTTLAPKRGKYEDITFKFQMPLQIAAERELARSLLGDPNFSWTVGFKEYPHPAAKRADGSFSEFQLLATPFLFTIAMFSFVFQISSIVLEKELKLRQAMNIMGLYDSAYWLSWLLWETFMILISSLCTVLAGMIFQFNFFLHNSFIIVFLVFFLFQLNMTGFAFMLSAFLGKSSSAYRAGFWIFLIGAIIQLGTPAVTPSKNSRIFYCLPPSLLAYAIQMLISATESSNSPGISWASRVKCAPDSVEQHCYLSMSDVYMRLIYTFICWFLLALYFDNIMPSPNGTSKCVLYFLDPRYWTGIGGRGGNCCSSSSASVPDNTASNDEDVLEEENTVKQQMRSRHIDPNIAIQIRGLIKSYSGKLVKKGCCNWRRTPPFHAIKGLYLNIAKDQLFCLLGPNGAGKTSTINFLTGIMSVTGGDAIIYGNSIRSSVGMSNIRKIIGVCPQFDILWNMLTGEEHLELFASIKGLPPASLKQVIKKSLEEVRLTDSAKVRICSYSGGMKRRLSVASALIGDPRLVVLDEPTTGMDPISRRHVWDIIENAKRGRAIILTTHSMEEADVLGDRIGIMAKGRLRCIGTSIRLKSRFGTGFIAHLRFAGNDSAVNCGYKEAVKGFFRNYLGVSPKEENNAFLTFVIPREKEGLLKVTLRELEDRQREFGITDIQIGLTTLEEVFLNIAWQAELDSAVAEGRFVNLALSSGRSYKIPVGARRVVIPGTETVENPRGMMVEVYWEADVSGALFISGHSMEMPVPENAQVQHPVADRPRSLGHHETPLIFDVLFDPVRPISNSAVDDLLGTNRGARVSRA